MATLNASTFTGRAEAESHYLGLIDAAAAHVRHIDPAQAEIYQAKLGQARAGGGALLSAEAEATGSTAELVRQAVLRESARREHFVTAVELKRVGAKAAIRRADNSAEMHTIYHTFKGAL